MKKKKIIMEENLGQRFFGEDHIAKFGSHSDTENVPGNVYTKNETLSMRELIFVAMHIFLFGSLSIPDIDILNKVQLFVSFPIL